MYSSVTERLIGTAGVRVSGSGFSSVEIEYVPGDYKDLAMGVELNGRTLLKGEHVPLTAHLVLKVSSGDPNMLPDSLALDSIPVEPLDSDIENWF